MFYPTTCVRLRYGPYKDMLSGFSWELDYLHYQIVPEDALYCHFSSSPADLPTGNITTGFNALFRQCAGVSLLRRHIALHTGN